MKRKLTFVLAVFCFVAMQAQTVVNFTADEGYSNGSIYTHADWDGTFTWPTWEVDAATGIVTTTKNWQRAVWGQAFTVSGNGEEIKFRADFSFTGTLNVVNTPLILFGFSTTSVHNTGAHNFLYINTRTFNSQLQLRNNTNAGNLTPNASLVIADSQGDELAVEITLGLGIDAASSTISGKLINITDGVSSDLGAYTGVDAAIYSAATTTGVYGMFHSQDFQTGQGLTAINISRVEMTTGVLSSGANPVLPKFEVAPNPVTSEVQVTGINIGDRIDIYSMLGAKVATYVYNGIDLDLSNLEPGLYVMKIPGWVDKKIIKN